MSEPANPFRCFNSPPAVIRLIVKMYVRYPLSLPNVDDLLPERGVDIWHETVRCWWMRFGPALAWSNRQWLSTIPCVSAAGAVSLIATGLRLADEGQNWPNSGGNILPIGQRSRAVDLIGLTIDEVALPIEMIV